MDRVLRADICWKNIDNHASEVNKPYTMSECQYLCVFVYYV